MAKRNLAGLLGSIDPDTTQTDPPAATSAPAEPDAPSAKDLEPQTSEPSAAAAPAPPRAPAGARSGGTRPAGDRAGAGPRYLQLDRKELRIRGDQADALTALTRQLNRSRRGTGERITDNTLIRVAIDLLLRQRGNLRGTTEADLLRSVTTELTESRPA